MILFIIIIVILINTEANDDDIYKMFMDRIERIANRQHGSIIKYVNVYDNINIKSIIEIDIDNNHSHYFVTNTNNSIIFHTNITRDITTDITNSIVLGTTFPIVDFRLISIASKTFIIFIDTSKDLLSYTMLHTYGTNFYINDNDIAYIDTQNAPDDCKNLKTWMPVPNSDVKTEGHPGFAFVCSIYPHRIVTFDVSSNTTKRSMSLLTDDKHVKRVNDSYRS